MLLCNKSSQGAGVALVVKKGAGTETYRIGRKVQLRH